MNGKSIRKQTPLTAPRGTSMPDLSSLFRSNLLTAILAHAFNAGGPESVRTGILLRTFVRIVDKALDEYVLARETFLEYVSRQSRSLGTLFRAIGQMENCVASVDRALRFAKRLSEEPELSGHISTSVAVLSKPARRIAILRNATEHLDARVLKGEISDGDLNTLWMAEDYIEFEGERVRYGEFAAWLTQLHALALSMASFVTPKHRTSVGSKPILTRTEAPRE